MSTIEDSLEIRLNFGEKFVFMCKIASDFKNFKSSCLGILKDQSPCELSDEETAVIAEFFKPAFESTVLNRVSRNEGKVFERDIARLILSLRKLWEIFRVRSKVSIHLIWHCGDSLVRLGENDRFAMGLTNCSQFESVHYEFTGQVKNALPTDFESYNYRDSLLKQVAIFNNKYLLKSIDVNNVKLMYNQQE